MAIKGITGHRSQLSVISVAISLLTLMPLPLAKAGGLTIHLALGPFRSQTLFSNFVSARTKMNKLKLLITICLITIEKSKTNCFSTWQEKSSWQKREFLAAKFESKSVVVFPQPVFSSDVEGTRKMVEFLSLVEIFEHGALHVLAPTPTPVG